MKAKLFIENPDEIEFTLKITMTLGAWKKLREQLVSVNYPSYRLVEAINDLIVRAGTSFSYEPPERGQTITTIPDSQP